MHATAWTCFWNQRKGSRFGVHLLQHYCRVVSSPHCIVLSCRIDRTKDRGSDSDSDSDACSSDAQTWQ